MSKPLTIAAVYGHWFVPDAEPTNLSEEQRALLERGARSFLEGMARGVATLAPPLDLAEVFFAQRVGPGHFQSSQDMFMEMAGAPAPPAEVS